MMTKEQINKCYWDIRKARYGGDIGPLDAANDNYRILSFNSIVDWVRSIQDDQSVIVDYTLIEMVEYELSKKLNTYFNLCIEAFNTAGSHLYISHEMKAVAEDIGLLTRWLKSQK